MQDEKKDKLLDIAVVLLGLAVIGVAAYLIILITFGGTMANAESYSYDCESFEEQVQNTNQAIIDWYMENVDSKYDEILISPISVQSAVYNYYNSQNLEYPYVFDKFSNGYRSWSESGKLFNSECLSYIQSGTVDSTESLIGILSNYTGQYITSLGKDVEINLDDAYSVFSLNANIQDSFYSKLERMICYQGKLSYKLTEDYQAYCFPLDDNTHSAYLITGDLSEFTFDDFEVDNFDVKVSLRIWQTYGSIDGLKNAFMADESDFSLKVISQFGFSQETATEDSYFKEYGNSLIFTEGYSILIVDNETGLILAVGKC